MPLIFLNGGAMRGGPLHHLLDGAPLVAATTTAPRYRFYSVAGQCPALSPVAHGGAEVAGEVYDVPMDVLRDRLLPAEPPELELGVVELADGSSALAMLLRRPGASFARLTDITEHGSWQAYLDAREKAA
ncbi:allophanate hydrolase-related protein [Actinomadura macrotermitis]|uniref:Allophanate hydrolase C-terminal domain-containing protein n=1 Tax=Actinomadura macrotermitis TaxID=2585200 RepID=A0A7K0BQJ7_9ACTN|nr:gamma-glutamylcyclotransferase [Actinomadura macrotermitis]MQY03306.1 hypothetical protein [Actinomadura macrotermitis]